MYPVYSSQYKVLYLHFSAVQSITPGNRRLVRWLRSVAQERVAFSESHDLHGMRPQVDSDDPNGPRAPLLSNFDDLDGWEPTESPGDHFSFPTSVGGQTGEVHHMAPVLVPQSSSVVRLVHWILSARCGGIWVPLSPQIQPRAGFVGRPTRDPAHPYPIHCLPVESRERETQQSNCLSSHVSTFQQGF